eukprot:COSAG01_NODE_11145_length_1997_cov_2.231823_2_plen_214_part_00
MGTCTWEIIGASDPPACVSGHTNSDTVAKLIVNSDVASRKPPKAPRAWQAGRRNRASWYVGEQAQSRFLSAGTTAATVPLLVEVPLVVVADRLEPASMDELQRRPSVPPCIVSHAPISSLAYPTFVHAPSRISSTMRPASSLSFCSPELHDGCSQASTRGPLSPITRTLKVGWCTVPVWRVHELRRRRELACNTAFQPSRRHRRPSCCCCCCC